MKNSSLLKDSLIAFITELPDPRVQGRCKHSLVSIVAISVCALLCGAENCIEIAEFGRYRLSWFQKYLKLPYGIPSHDTFARVFSILKAEAFERLFFAWAESLRAHAVNVIAPEPDDSSRQLCLDGKAVGGTTGRLNSGHLPLHLVSVFCSDTGLTLGQKRARCSGTGGEPDAVLECLEALDIRGAIISVDAANSIRRVSDAIRERHADYLMPIKRNQRHSLTELETLFASPKARTSKASESEDLHGRHEERHCRVASAKSLSPGFHGQWKDVQSVIEITRRRTAPDKRYCLRRKAKAGGEVYELNPNTQRTTEEKIHYISSRKLTPLEAIQRTRMHWGIENRLHWSLDVAWREDQWPTRNQKAAHTLAVIRKMAFNLVRNFPDSGSQKVKIKRAAWDPDYLARILFRHTEGENKLHTG